MKPRTDGEHNVGTISIEGENYDIIEKVGDGKFANVSVKINRNAVPIDLNKVGLTAEEVVEADTEEQKTEL
jgi:hypothetical protein